MFDGEFYCILKIKCNILLTHPFLPILWISCIVLDTTVMVALKLAGWVGYVRFFFWGGGGGWLGFLFGI